LNYFKYLDEFCLKTDQWKVWLIKINKR